MANTTCQSCFWMDGYRSAPYLAVFYADICTGGLGASSASLFPIAGLSAEVIQLPDMTALHGVFQGPQNRIAGSGKIVTWIAEK